VSTPPTPIGCRRGDLIAIADLLPDDHMTYRTTARQVATATTPHPAAGGVLRGGAV
jgi:hypothetical protein